MDSPVKSKKRRSRKVKIIIAVSTAAVLTAGGVAGLLYMKSQNVSKNITSTVTYENYTVAKGNVDVTVQESGTIAAGEATSVKADQDITISGFTAQVGDAVVKGDTIAAVDTDTLKTNIETLKTSISDLDSQLAAANTSTGNKYLSSTVEGRVKLLNAKAGDVVQKNMDDYGYLCVISTDGHMKVSFSPVEGTTVNVGDAVTITFADGTTETSVIDSKTSDGQYVALIAEDTYDVGAQVGISNAAGVKVGSGGLAVNAPIPVTLSSGTIRSVVVDENEYVYSGSTLLYLTEGQLSDSVLALMDQRETAWNNLLSAKALLANPAITAQQDGVISAVTNAAGNAVKANEVIYQIVPDSNFNMTISVDELDISKIKKGQTATVTIDALSDQTVKGTVTRISNIGTTTNSVTTYAVTVTLDKTAGMMAGMSSSCTIAIDSATGVLYVPVGAVQTIANKKYVLVAAGTASAASASSLPSNTAKTAAVTPAGTLVEVQLGLINDSYAEITSGLTEGQVVLVPTFTSTSSTSTLTSGFPAVGMMGDFTGGSRPSGSMGNQNAAPAA